MKEIDQLVKNLKTKIEGLAPNISEAEIGNVVSISDGIARVSGLSGTQASEILKFESGALGLALNLEEDFIGCIILGEFKSVKEGESVARTHEILSIPVSDDIIGRVVNSLGEEIDGKGKIKASKRVLVEKIAPGVMKREPVNQPLQTGIKAIDAMIPIGRGQRELIIGDRQTGKTAIAIDTILNQKGENIVCIYVAIGQKQSKVARIVSRLEEGGAMDYTVVVSAAASDAPAMLYLAPYSGVSIAEYFMDQGKDVLIIYDDLSNLTW
jgi:F-type H+-transporting ATPase subunit alpha